MREYLLFKRYPRPELELPSFWQGISGGMELGGSLQEVALREVKEESGIVLQTILKSGFVSRFPIKEVWRKSYGPLPTHVEEHVFFSEVDCQPILSDEHSEYKWCCYDDARKLLSFGDNRLALESVENTFFT